MAGAPQQGGRRAWGAAPPPRPAAEQRRAVEAAAAATEPMAPLPPPAHLPHPPHRKLALPRLNNAAASPRGGGASGSGDGAPQRRGWGLLPPKHPVPAVAPADSELPPETIPAQHAPPWAPPPLASASPAALPGIAALPEDNDAVLIGSTAPSFTTQHQIQGQQQGQQQQQQQQQQHPESNAPRGSHAHMPAASQQHSRRPSQLGAEDMSLAALAAAHARGPAARYSTATAGSAFPASLPSSRGSSAASEHVARAQCGSPPATAGGPWQAGELQQQQRKELPALLPQQQQQQLSSGELAVLRQSLLDLELPDGISAGADGDVIPDQLVLHELSSRLGRLDSQKRRVLLAVLAKIDGAALAGEPSVAGSAHEEADSEARRLIAESAGGTRQASAAEEGGAPGGAASLPSQEPPDSQHATAASADRVEEQHAPSATGVAALEAQSDARERSMADKLAALRLGRTSSLGKPSGDAEHQHEQQGGDAVVTVSPAVALAPAGVGDSLELLPQASQQDAGALPPLSARGGLARTSTLPVRPPAVRQQAGLGAAKASAEAAAALAALERRGSTLAVPAPSHGSASGSAPAAASSAGVLHCQELTFVLLDTWGDSHFVGLSGLQVLGADGEPVPLGAEQLAADPPDLNVFPGHSGDVRTLDKLVDSTANTTDDAHMWLAPVKRQLSAAVASAASSTPAARGAAAAAAALPEAARAYNVLRVALPPGGAAVTNLRVWNYNKSATDTARGVKRMLVLADGVEVSPPGGVLVRRAPGTAAFPFGQHIPLTTMWSAAAAASAAGKAKQQQRRTTQQSSTQRAAAAGCGGGVVQQQQLTLHSESVAWVCNLPDPAAALEYLQRAALLAKAAGPSGGLLAQPGENFATPLPCGFSLRLVLLSSWGCPHYVGLSGLEVRDAVRGPLTIRPDQVYAVPSSVALLPGMASDVRTPDKLVDGDTSGAPQHSWLAPQETREPNSVVVSLDAPLLLGSLRLWNYAKTPSRGVQQLEVYLDEQLVWKGLLQRAPAEPAPGQDFSQALCFSEEALAEAAATARRRAGSPAHLAGQPPGGASAAGDALGADGVEEWCQEQERVVLVNNGSFIAWPPDSTAAPPTARPGTSVRLGGAVLGLEAQPAAPHSRGSSHGLTRIIRSCYFEHPSYVPLVRESFRLWRQLEAAAGEQLLSLVGCLNAAPAGPLQGLPGLSCFDGALLAAQEHGLAHEVLSPAEVAARHPAFHLPRDFKALVEPEAGLLAPERCIAAHLALAQQHGAQLLCGARLQGWRVEQGSTGRGGARVHVHSSAGSFVARRLVLAGGGWMPQLVPELQPLLTVERQVVGWFEVPPAVRQMFEPAAFPTCLLQDDGGYYYGFPADEHGIKIGKYNHRHEAVTADSVGRAVDSEDEQVLRECLRRFFPAAAEGRLTRATACTFTNTPDSHFILDRHPRWPQVVLASACSGHGFKFAPVLGSILADLALSPDGSTEHDIALHRLRHERPGVAAAVTALEGGEGAAAVQRAYLLYSFDAEQYDGSNCTDVPQPGVCQQYFMLPGAEAGAGEPAVLPAAYPATSSAAWLLLETTTSLRCPATTPGSFKWM
ncbi:N-methyltryptophan oxidase [Micractinium conductrix]|uniref:N-methyltryptophan oxidase n=1 Tax=Micractinium conductrix TaxID=554055 RepID=A0A2P6VQH9_9CHLO|nr:N-methyltryptophan oxidase [Micractinium conductrix]|eukprot:PSC76354.1 N-methyltryptophan oxidase [Micractinium conductrix]